MAVTTAVGMVAMEARAQSPPNPNFQRSQLFGSYQEFKDRLNAITAVADAAQRTAQLDALWAQLKGAGQVPYAQGDRVAFLYRGSASSVAWPGDFNGWNPAASGWRGTRLASTDLWMLEKTFPADARLDYKIVTGGSVWMLDPANSLQIWSGFGPNSELRMPDYAYPQETVRRDGIARGNFSANVKFASAQLGYDVNYRVYTPAGYAAQQLHNLPVVYVTDGHEYAADHLGSMVVVLDNLIARGALQPTVAVFVDPRDPATGANRRAAEYVQNSRFAGFVADELAPAVDRAYRTLAAPDGRMILGTSLGGLNSAYFGATRSDVFGKIAVQSPASFTNFAPQLLQSYATQPLQQRLEIFLSAGTIGDGNAGPSFAAVLSEHGYDYRFIQTHEGHSWGNWRALLDDALVQLIGPAAVVEGDFNGDGAVDAADLARWQSGVGKATGAVRLDGDADGDRDVDGADFLLWQRQAGAPAAPVSAPEPGAAALIGCGLLGVGTALRSHGRGARP
jgi:enterochelin esterase family protein